MRHRSTLAAAGCLLGSIALLGCSSALLPSRATDRGDVSELKRRVLELQQQAAVAQVELDRVRRELALLRDRSSTEDPSEEPGGSEGSRARESLHQISTALSPELAVSSRGSVETSDLAPRTIEPRTSGPGVEAGAPVVVAPSGDSPGEDDVADSSPAAIDDQRAVSDEAQALYDRGYTLYHQTRYVDAESGFRRFLQIYPQNELSDNAQYWIGECRYARGDIRGALAAFQETVERYPTGNKVPDAILKLAGCLVELGANEAAQARYDEVIRRFPSTAAATMAQERRQNGE